MKVLIRWSVILGIFLGFISVIFFLYSRFLVDYSLENLEFALTVMDKPVQATHSASQEVYKSVLEDLAVEETVAEKTDFKNAALLEIAGRSFDESLERAGNNRARIYLQQVINAKRPERSSALHLFDQVYYQIRNVGKMLQRMVAYYRDKAQKKPAQISNAEGLLILNHAQIEEGKMNFEKSAALYRQFLKEYPFSKDSGYVKLLLGRALLKQGRFDEAKQVANEARFSLIGTEEADIAENLIRKIEKLTELKKQAADLEKTALAESDPMIAGEMRLKLVLIYLSIYKFDRAEKILAQLVSSPNREIAQKAVYYRAWLFKQKKEYGSGEKLLVQLLDEGKFSRQLEFGLRAQLADIYYQQHDIDKTLEQYQVLSQKAGIEPSAALLEQQREDMISKKAMDQAWIVLSEIEQANIYFFDLKDEDRANESLNRAAGFLGTENVERLHQRLTEEMQLNLRDKAFKALASKQVSLAYELFTRNLMYSPEDAWSHSGLATVYVLMGNVQSALQQAELGIKYGADEYTLSIAAYLYGLFERDLESVTFYQRARKQSPGYVAAPFNLSCIYLKMRDSAKALEILQALSKRGDISDYIRSKLYNNMGIAYWQQNQKDQAEMYFRKALEIKPDSPAAQKNLANLSGGGTPEMSQIKE